MNSMSAWKIIKVVDEFNELEKLGVYSLELYKTDPNQLGHALLTNEAFREMFCDMELEYEFYHHVKNELGNEAYFCNVFWNKIKFSTVYRINEVS